MKRFSALLCFVVLIFFCSPVLVFAEIDIDTDKPDQRKGLEFIINGNEATIISKGNYTDSVDLIIPESVTPDNVHFYTVTAIGDNAFYQNKEFTGTLSIPDTVKSIGTKAFMWCENFTELILGDSIISIGEEAFEQCKKFEGTLSIPDSVTSIGLGAFSYCSGFTGLSIPDSVTSIGDGVFQSCAGFTGTLTIPNTVTSIGMGAFSWCENFTELILGDSVTSIGTMAFSYCSGLTGNLYIPNSVTSIDVYAFYGCTQIDGIILPDSLTSIGSSFMPDGKKLYTYKSIYDSFKNRFSTVSESNLFLFTEDFEISGDDFVDVGNTITISSTIDPSDARNDGITWSSSDNSIATVTDGVVTGMDTGYVTITSTLIDIYVYSENPGPNDWTPKEIKVKVGNPPESVTLDKDILSLQPNETDILTATVLPADASNKEVIWSSSDDSIVSVDANGNITAHKVGSATITVTTKVGGFTDTCEVTVSTAPIPVNGVELSPSSLTLSPADSRKLTATVLPADASNKNVTWSSSDSSIVSVDANGNITAHKVGFATITVTTEVGGYTDTCDVTVEQSVNVTVKVILQTNGKKGAPADLNSKKLNLVLSVKQNGVPYQSQELEVDMKTLSGLIETFLDFRFPVGTPAFIWNAEVSLKGFSGSVKDKNNKSYQISGVPDINREGKISLILDFKKTAEGKKSHGYPAWRLPEDYIGAYNLIDQRTHEKVYLLFHTYDICVQYLGDPALCEGYERCFHKDLPCPWWDPYCKHNVKNPDPE